MSDSPIDAVEASLRRRFRVIETSVPVADRMLSILHPANAEELIDEQDFARDERLPYWAELWPSARIMAAEIIAMPGGGRTLLELGCGSGLVASCAALAGFDVVASDYYEDAMRFAQVNAMRAGATVRGLVLDWRHLPTTLPRFDVVIASDVLYERPYGELVARTIAETLASGGVAYLADPGRVGREAFMRALEPLGLSVARQSERAFEDGNVRQTISIFEIRWQT